MKIKIKDIPLAVFKAKITKLHNNVLKEEQRFWQSHQPSEPPPSNYQSPPKPKPPHKHVDILPTVSISEKKYFGDASEIPGMFGLKGIMRFGWRKADRLYGQIHALPTMRGRLLATNGILCAIQRGDDSIVLGHYENFEVDSPKDVDKIIDKSKPTKRKSRLEKTLADYA